MGLDMYLIKKKKDVKKEIKEMQWSELEEIAYWRKANQIHKWFVDNVQDGEDNCEYYKVTSDKLQKLVDICNEILNKVELIDGQVLLRDYYQSKDGKSEHIKEYGIGKLIDKPEICEELLPTQSGFFFGGTEYDEWYYEDIRRTRDRLQAIIDLLEWDLYEVYYGSSW